MTIKQSKSNDNRDGDEDRESAVAGQIITPNGKMFTYEELKSATGNFIPDTVVGDGGFGRVVKGWVDRETYAPSKQGVGLAVAVMKYNPDGCQRLQGEAFRAKNPNLGKLLGYCWEENQFLLVYEYKEEGSLETHPFRQDGDTMWETRLKIVMSLTEALSFLHTTHKRVIHQDLKPSNILLDRDFSAKLSDFELANTEQAGSGAGVCRSSLG